MKAHIQSGGFALPTLMALLTLASIATLLAMRTLWVNDQLLNGEADQLRTQHKAQAALPLAVADIVGPAASATSAGEAKPSLRHTVGSDTQTHAFFPATLSDYNTLRQRLGTDACRSGICAPAALDTAATRASYWRAQTHSAMPVNASDTPYGADSAWYWVEVFPQASAAIFVYRITVLANGVMPGSSTVLQGIWARSTPTSPTGQWQSWHVLHD